MFITAKGLKEIISAIPDETIISGSQNEQGIDLGFLRLADWDSEFRTLNLLFSYGDTISNDDQGAVVNRAAQGGFQVSASEEGCDMAAGLISKKNWERVLDDLAEVLK